MSDPNPDISGLLQQFHPHSDILLGALRPWVDDSMLRSIAEADYGLNADSHWAALLRIRNHGEVPVPIKWDPQEVLELTRWSEPEIGNSRENLIRAFSCAALLRAGGEPANYWYSGSENDTLVQLVESTLVLKRDFTGPSVRFFAWRALRPDGLYGQTAPFLAAILLVSATRRPSATDQRLLLQLANWILMEELRLREIGEELSGALLRLGAAFRGQRHDKWCYLVRQLFLRTPSEIAEPLATSLAHIAGRVIRSDS